MAMSTPSRTSKRWGVLSEDSLLLRPEAELEVGLEVLLGPVGVSELDGGGESFGESGFMDILPFCLGMP
jgi:hypothetical protein